MASQPERTRSPPAQGRPRPDAQPYRWEIAGRRRVRPAAGVQRRGSRAPLYLLEVRVGGLVRLREELDHLRVAEARAHVRDAVGEVGEGACLRGRAHRLEDEPSHGPLRRGEVEGEDVEPTLVIAEQVARRVDPLVRLEDRKGDRDRLEVRAGVEGDGALSEDYHPATLDGDQHVGARLHVDGGPRPVAKVLLLQQYLVRLQVPPLPRVLV